LREQQPRRGEERLARIRTLEEQMGGWRSSLGNPALSPALRQDLEGDYERANQEKAALRAELEAEQAIERQLHATLDPLQVIDALKRLDQVLAADNVTQINIELARHIERIDCEPDGRITIRGTCLGLFEGAVELLSRPDGTNEPAGVGEAGAADASQAPVGIQKVRPRRLGRRKVDDLSADQPLAAADADRVLDPHRFVGLAGSFVWEESFFLPRKLSWAQQYALEVLKYTHDNADATMYQVAAHFGKTPPTIRHALRLAEAAVKDVDAVDVSGENPQALADSESAPPEGQPDDDTVRGDDEDKAA